MKQVQEFHLTFRHSTGKTDDLGRYSDYPKMHNAVTEHLKGYAPHLIAESYPITYVGDRRLFFVSGTDIYYEITTEQKDP